MRYGSLLFKWVWSCGKWNFTFKMRVQLDSNTEHWNTDLYEVRFLNGPDHWKTKLFASLDRLILKHNFSYKMAKAIQVNKKKLSRYTHIHIYKASLF